jgi:hypothetical protein
VDNKLCPFPEPEVPTSKIIIFKSKNKKYFYISSEYTFHCHQDDPDETSKTRISFNNLPESSSSSSSSSSRRSLSTSILRASNAVNYDKFLVACQKMDVNENEETEAYLDVCKVDVIVINQVIITLSVFLSVYLSVCLSVFLPPLFFSLLGLNFK